MKYNILIFLLLFLLFYYYFLSFINSTFKNAFWAENNEQQLNEASQGIPQILTFEDKY